MLSKTFKCVSVLLFCAIVLCACFSTSVSALVEKTGFVEYETDEVADFYEIIEIVLTNQKTGKQYTHYLYKENEYISNEKVSFGTYDVTAKVISENQDDLSMYVVECLKDEILVDNEQLATVIPLRLVTFMNVEASASDYGNLNNTISDTVDSNNITSIKVEDNNKTGTGNSLLVSTLVFGGIVLVMTVVYFCYIKRFFKK